MIATTKTTIKHITSIDQARLVVRPSVEMIAEEGIFSTLPEKGLDRLLQARIEHIICTSALAGFF
jgi:hypothetical protein